MRAGMTDKFVYRHPLTMHIAGSHEQAHLTGAPAGEMNNIGGIKEVAMKI